MHSWRPRRTLGLEVVLVVSAIGIVVLEATRPDPRALPYEAVATVGVAPRHLPSGERFVRPVLIVPPSARAEHDPSAASCVVPVKGVCDAPPSRP